MSPLLTRTRRVHVFALVVCSVLWMSVSATPSPVRTHAGAASAAHSSTHSSAHATGRAPLGQRAPLDAAGVAAIVEAANPHLGDPVRIGEAVVRYSAHYGLDPELVTAVLIVESDARPWARSHKGAVGLMQVMPYMTHPLDLGGNLTAVETNLAAGCAILAGNIQRLGEDDGISAYFWGSRIRSDTYLMRVRSAQSRIREMRSRLLL